jgi:Carboxypeptidase regulatory-like domain
MADPAFPKRGAVSGTRRLQLCALRPQLEAGFILLTLPVFSQTNPTGTISGKLTDQQSLPVAGATVTVESPALQASRSVLTSSNGDYVLPFLPPGDYTLKIELSGFNTNHTTGPDLAESDPDRERDHGGQHRDRDRHGGGPRRR